MILYLDCQINQWYISVNWPKQCQNMYSMISHSGNIMNSAYGKPDHPIPTETRYQDEDLFKKLASDLATPEC